MVSLLYRSTLLTWIAVIVTLTMTTSFELAIPAVMLTVLGEECFRLFSAHYSSNFVVLGVVLGFVISYRAGSFDRIQFYTPLT